MAKKTNEEKLQELTQKMEQLKAQKKAIQAKENKILRAQRTRRLIQNGALAEKYLCCENADSETFEKVLNELVKIGEVKQLLATLNRGAGNE